MSGATEAVQAALLAALRGHAALAAAATAIDPARAARTSLPAVEVGEAATGDWSHKSGSGREHRLAVLIRDDAREPARVHRLADLVEQAVAAMPRDLAGHRIASLTFLRTRVARGRDGQWTALVEHRARTLAG